MRPLQVPIEALQPGDIIAVPKLGQGIQPRPYIEFFRFEDVIGYDRFRCSFFARGVRLLGDGQEKRETLTLDVRYAVWVVGRGVEEGEGDTDGQAYVGHDREHRDRDHQLRPRGSDDD